MSSTRRKKSPQQVLGRVEDYLQISFIRAFDEFSGQHFAPFLVLAHLV